MADTKISALPAATTLGDADELVLNVAGANKKITGANVKASMPAGGGGGGELAYATRTTDLAVAATSAAAADTVVSSGAVTYAATRIKIEVFCARVKASSGAYAIFALWDGSTNLSVALGEFYYQGSVSLDAPFYGAYFLTPTAGSHTYTWKVWQAVPTITMYSTPGSGNAPAFIRVTAA